MTDAVRTTTLEELVQRVAFRLGDLELVQSTANGSVSELIDAVNVPLGGRDFTRRQMVFTSGDNRGTVVVVVNTNPTSHSINFSPSMVDAIPSGVTAYLINKQGGGFSYLEYKRAINMAIDGAYPIARTKISTTATFDGAAPTITVGSTIGEVYAVEALDSDGNWIPIPAAEHRGYHGWYADRVDGSLTVNGAYLSDWMDGLTVRLRGEGRHPQLDTYSETTKLHPDWIESQACYNLAMMGMDRDISGQRQRQVLTYQREAEMRLNLIRVYREPESDVGRQ